MAVRCFLNQIGDQEKRYAEISRYIQNDKLPYTVGFDYMTAGIKVGAGWYPILRMDWVSGLTLTEFLARHLDDKQTISDLAADFKSMCQELRKEGIAHGDLQHGNILVTGEGLRLVDYDGMFVPKLAGLPSNELGHRNYQHPLRNQSHFGPYLDNFSSWVIYVSLMTLAIDPKLWKKFSGGDECLLFRQNDFARPAQSDLLRQMNKHQSKKIKTMSRTMQEIIELELEQIPALTDFE